jgi:hypothetical protein
VDSEDQGITMRPMLSGQSDIIKRGKVLYAA